MDIFSNKPIEREVQQHIMRDLLDHTFAVPLFGPAEYWNGLLKKWRWDDVHATCTSSGIVYIYTDWFNVDLTKVKETYDGQRRQADRADS